MNPKFNSSKHLSRIQYWVPPTQSVEPRKEELSTDLKIAFIGTEKVYDGLRFEADLCFLVKETWLHILQTIDIDFLLVESCLRTVTGDWAFAQCSNTGNHEELIRVIDFAKKMNIPTVYWNTQDHVYHSLYKDISRHFDHVFCADVNERNLLLGENVEAVLLQPAVQPAIYNRFKFYADCDEFEVDLLFDGWSDLFRFESSIKVLRDLKCYGLKIVDSKREIFRTKLSELPDYKDHILGCVTTRDKRTLLKHTKKIITFQQSLVTPTSQQWDALESIACRVSVIYQGELESNDIRNNIVLQSADDKNTVEILKYYSDDNCRERSVHKAWRTVNTKHTFYHRLESISKQLKLNFISKYDKVASLITPSYRADYIEQAIRTFQSQSYPFKELILIYNGSDEIAGDTLKEIGQSKDIVLLKMPPEESVSECLNLGHQNSRGEYCMRIDDDDFYAENYILDMMLHLHCRDADIFGKAPGNVYFEQEDKIYTRKKRIPQLAIVSIPDITSEVVRISGNTIGGKRSFLLNEEYPSKACGAADTGLLLNLSDCELSELLILDNFNMLVHRRADNESHTWRLKSKKPFVPTDHSYESASV